MLVAAAVASSLLAARSLREHVEAVADPLVDGDLPRARAAVSHIVGRDVTTLDAAGVARASLETLAESTSDGVVAPLCFGLLLGLPGLALYKAVNTLDSMIGHRTAQLSAFGGFAARLDDLANWVPARLTALLLLAAGGMAARARGGVAALRRDARAHRSVNAGWPEAALAGVLGVRLSGPRSYGGRLTQEPWINAAAPDPQAGDLTAGLALYRRVVLLLALALAALATVAAATATAIVAATPTPTAGGLPGFSP